MCLGDEHIQLLSPHTVESRKIETDEQVGSKRVSKPIVCFYRSISFESREDWRYETKHLPVWFSEAPYLDCLSRESSSPTLVTSSIFSTV